MDKHARSSFSFATLSLIVVLLAPLALASHQAEDHLPIPVGRSETVYLSGHDQADDSLHVEPLAGTWELHCPGCILRKQGDSALLQPPAATAERPAGGLDGTSGPPAPISPSLSSQAPRAPPSR